MKKQKAWSIPASRAMEAIQRLINSHFGQSDAARTSIPASPHDDDLVASAYVEQSSKRITTLEEGYRRHRAERRVWRKDWHEMQANNKLLRGVLQEIADCKIHPQCSAARSARAALSSAVPKRSKP